MPLVLMVLLPFPLGLLVRSRQAALLAFTAVSAFLYTSQTLVLVVEWVGGDDKAFGGVFPAYRLREVYAYVAFNAVVYVASLGLVVLGHRVARRRRAPEAALAVA